MEKNKRESKFDIALNLPRLMDKRIRIKFKQGRQCVGLLKGYDEKLNLVLDETIEYLRDPDDLERLTNVTRNLGLLVCRGVSILMLCPEEGIEEIPDPFDHNN